MSRRDNGPAISFFSFQDIITSITGILFLVVLLLLLLLFETDRSAPVPDSAVSEPIADLRKTLRNLQTQISEQEAETESFRKQIEELRNFPPARLEAEREELLSAIRRETEETAALRADSKKLEERLPLLEERREQLEFRSTRLARQLARLQSQLEEQETVLHREQLSRERREKLIRYSVRGNFPKQPRIIECGPKDFRAGSPESATPALILPASTPTERIRAVDEILKWAGTHDPSQVFFFLLAKPSAFAVTEELADRLSRAGYDRGREVMPSDDSTVFEESEHGR